MATCNDKNNAGNYMVLNNNLYSETYTNHRLKCCHYRLYKDVYSLKAVCQWISNVRRT